MYCLRILATLACVAALYVSGDVVIPIILGVFLFFLLDPMVDKLEKKKVPRGASSTVLVFLSILISASLIWLLYGAVADIARELPSYSQKIQGLVKSVKTKAETIQSNAVKATETSTPTPSDVQKVQVVGGGFGEVTGFAIKGLGTLFSVLALAFFVPLVSLFLLLEKKDLAPATNDFMGQAFETHHIFLEITRMLKSFFIGNLVIGLLMAVIFAILFSVIGLKNSVSLGVITGFLNLIPLIGPFLSVILPTAAGLLQFSSPGPFIIMGGVIFFLHFFTANFVVPKIVGGHINVNAISSTISLIFWGWLWGAIGVLIAIPLTALLRIFLENYKPTQSLARLIADSNKS